MPNWRQSINKIQRSSCTPRRYCKRRLRVLRSIPWTRIVSIPNDSRKSHGYHIQTDRMIRTSSWRSICLHPGKNGRCSKIIEKSKIGMSRHLDSSTTTQNGLNHGPVWKTQLFLLSEICTVIVWQDYCGKVNLWKSYWNMAWRRFPIGNAYFFMVLWHGWSCQGMCGTILWVGKQDDATTLQNINSMPWPPSLQKGRNQICWRIVKSMLSNCSEMLLHRTYWKTWYSVVSE